MSTISPRSLLYLTVDFIARNYQQLCEEQRVVEVHDQPSNITERISLLAFKNDCCLPSTTCDLLLQRFFFHYNSSLPLDFLTLFADPGRCPLKRFTTGNVYHKFHVPKDKFLNILEMIIKCQNLVELDAGPIFNRKLFETDFSTSRCAITLKKLTICEVVSPGSIPYVDRPLTLGNFFRNFSNLRHLSLNNCSNIKDNDVGTLASEMKHLESLDLSSTSVTGTEVFDRLTRKLKVLILHDTPLVDSDLTGLLEFANLCHLDISQKLRDNLNDPTNVKVNMFFTSQKSLLFLTSLDISGTGTLDCKALQIFLHKHSKLCFLGLLGVHCQLPNTMLKNVEVQN